MTTTPTTDLVTRLMDLWSTPLPDDDAAALAAFGRLYTDPVTINGTAMTLADLLARARAVQGAYGGLDREVLEQVEAPGKLVVAFRMLGTHTGPLATPLGTVPATGGPVDVRVIDVLTLTDGRISGIVMVADELTNLHRLGVLALADGVG
ncbi:SnoaL-like polyketide cyclase [Actinomycetospora succinea]|uniref:SnoaL-like polyketide cyclase n=1 Tax=Actinomycetospora succinea TaxID=663603 RepID=A0A4R6VLJ5_9PSEU|nr:ester cyclase [Actinomycetospora succinea]TDQ62782.1 SnoaL-like polyketide cyclase [Actinomycetospora succinea]